MIHIKSVAAPEFLFKGSIKNINYTKSIKKNIINLFDIFFSNTIKY